MTQMDADEKNLRESASSADKIFFMIPHIFMIF